MPTLRLVLIVLLALNLLAFAAICGWLGRPAADGEPERISNQLNPDRIRLAAVSPSAALLASNEPPAMMPRLPAPSPAPSPAASPAVDLPETPVAEIASEPPVPAPQPPAPQPESRTEASVPPLSCVVWANLTEADADRLADRLHSQGITIARSSHGEPSSWWVRIPPRGGLEGAEEQSRALRALGIKDSYIVREAGPAQYAISLGVFKTEDGAKKLLEALQARGLADGGIEPRLKLSHRVQAQLNDEARRAVERALPRLNRQRTACES
jgi:cell division septation protein DedD